MFGARVHPFEPEAGGSFRVGDLRIDPTTGRIAGPGGEVEADPKVMEVLVALARRPGEVMTREELLEAVWSERVVCEDVLSQSVYQLRKHLVVAGGHRRYRNLIQTLPKRGYRLNAPAAPSHFTGRRIGVYLLLLLAVGFGAAVLYYAGDPGPDSALEGSPAIEPASVAVLPFVNMSGDPEQEYFADGLTEELIARLSQVSELQVPARTSSFAFKGRDVDVREIARALGVATVLEGSVRADGDRVRVTAQLIDALTGFHYWSQTYDRTLTEIFAIQQDLAVRITEALEQHLTPDEIKQLGRRPTEVAEAYTNYLKGLYFWRLRSAFGLERAIEYLERAIEADPDFAAAYAGLASVYGPAGEIGYMEPRRAREQMGQAARRALELDPDLPEAHTVMAAFLHIHEWNWDGAERAFHRAIELNPDDAAPRVWYAYLSRALGRWEVQEAQLAVALELDPLSALSHSARATQYVRAGRIEDALVLFRNALELNPRYWMAHEALGHTYQLLGRYEEAIEALERAVEYGGPSLRPAAGLARVNALAGQRDAARAMLEDLEARAHETGNYYPSVATVHAALGDSDAAFAWLEKSFAQRHPRLQHLAYAAGIEFAGLRHDPRFTELLERIGLPAEALAQSARAAPTDQDTNQH